MTDRKVMGIDFELLAIDEGIQAPSLEQVKRLAKKAAKEVLEAIQLQDSKKGLIGDLEGVNTKGQGNRRERRRQAKRRRSNGTAH